MHATIQFEHLKLVLIFIFVLIKKFFWVLPQIILKPVDFPFFFFVDTILLPLYILSFKKKQTFTINWIFANFLRNWQQNFNDQLIKIFF